MDMLFYALVLFSAVCSGLLAGIFFAFSNFVMPALARIKKAEGIAAMQMINLTVINPLFLGAFIGTGITSVVLILAVSLSWYDTHTVVLIAGALIYVVGTFLVTMVGNVPWNDKLAAVAKESEEAAEIWRGYLKKWTLWNHVRTIASLMAAVAFTYILFQ